jgi:hypothetical protein
VTVRMPDDTVPSVLESLRLVNAIYFQARQIYSRPVRDMLIFRACYPLRWFRLETLLHFYR